MTNVEVVNLALAKLGASLILRLGDTSIPGSHFGALLYQPTLERALRDFPWSFAKREKLLAQLPAKLTERWNYSYSLPAGFIRLLRLLDKNGRANESFSRTGRELHCDLTPATLEFITGQIEPDDMDVDFREAFVTLLASELATPLLQSPQLAKSMMGEYLDVALPKAKAVDARETDSRENNTAYDAIARSPLVQSRHRNS